RPPTADERVPALPDAIDDRPLVGNEDRVTRLVLRLETDDIVRHAIAVRVDVEQQVHAFAIAAAGSDAPAEVQFGERAQHDAVVERIAPLRGAFSITAKGQAQAAGAQWRRSR